CARVKYAHVSYYIMRMEEQVAKLAKRPAARSTQESRPEKTRGGKPVRKQGRKPVKKPTNLTLDPDAVARGEQYGARHGRKLSQLVNGFLAALPAQESDEGLADLSPAVRRLYGIAAEGTTDRDAYRVHLLEKYGSRDA
ncbi:MAG TPA: DUF6364 family protein, partial [Gemmatimonadaceae bacterium]|nr:DUF6364 family protein [Gemmatimonadaceae bacterium]